MQTVLFARVLTDIATITLFDIFLCLTNVYETVVLCKRCYCSRHASNNQIFSE